MAAFQVNYPLFTFSTRPTNDSYLVSERLALFCSKKKLINFFDEKFKFEKGRFYSLHVGAS
jgi:hypothetical protein